MKGMDFPGIVDKEPDLEMETVLERAETFTDVSTGIASISIQAMERTPSPKIIRVIGQLKKRRVVILIDTGSTFGDTIVASKCGLMMQQCGAPIPLLEFGND